MCRGVHRVGVWHGALKYTSAKEKTDSMRCGCVVCVGEGGVLSFALPLSMIQGDMATHILHITFQCRCFSFFSFFFTLS